MEPPLFQNNMEHPKSKGYVVKRKIQTDKYGPPERQPYARKPPHLMDDKLKRPMVKSMTRDYERR
jgi:hypothetical protein